MQDVALVPVDECSSSDESEESELEEKGEGGNKALPELYMPLNVGSKRKIIEEVT